MGNKTDGRKKNQKPKHRSEAFKRHTNWHHVYPTSRFKIKKNPDLHTAWHDVFQNKIPEEAIETVKEWIIDHEKFQDKITNVPRRLRAWKMLFGKSALPSDEIIKIIEKDWTFHGVKMIKIERT
ncbi:MAG: hypothetical protein HYV47_04160 [Candidatus Nealsonbacteria bacterium]|nr:hypothetical protein [Candidatus Nealsonbacteria bacterium]